MSQPARLLHVSRWTRWTSSSAFSVVPADGDVDTAPMLRSLVHSLNAALGIERGKLDELLAPRDYGRGLRGKGFALLLPPDGWRSHRERRSAPDSRTRWPQRREYLETWPRTILLNAVDEGEVVATLSIPLLLFEVLDRAGRGFRPTTQAERGYMVRLHGFYRALAEHRGRATTRTRSMTTGRCSGEPASTPPTSG